MRSLSHLAISASLLFFLTLTFSLPVTSQTKSVSETLNNYTILNMVKKGLSDVIIIAKIKQSVCQFDLSTEALIFLKESKVSDQVITKMLEKSEEKEVDSPKQELTTVKSLSKDNGGKAFQEKNQSEVDKVLPHIFESGIYYHDKKENVFTKLEATVVTNNKSGGFGQALASSLTAGLANTKSKSVIDGLEANLKMSGPAPVFYFYFDRAKSSLNNSKNSITDDTGGDYMQLLYKNMANQVGGADNAVAMSPNDFKLIRLEVDKNSRSFISGKGNLYNMNSGIDSRYFMNFKYERLTTTLFRVTFTEDLKAGEYCFFYAGNSNKQSSLSNFYQVNSVKVFDFGVASENKKRK